MDEYFKTFSDRLFEHNKRGLQLWRSEVSSLYGNENAINHIHSVGHHAYSRSNIAKGDNNVYVNTFKKVGKVL